MASRPRVMLSDSRGGLPGRSGMDAAMSAVMGQDSLKNLTTGMGTDKDKLAGTFFGLGLMNKEQLEAAYRGDWIARKIVDIPAYDATREWRAWQADKDAITAVEDLEKALGLQRKTMTALTRGRLYGGGALIMGVEQGKPEEELIVDQVTEGQLKFVHVISRHELSAGPLESDILSPYYGMPQYFERSSAVSGSIRLHPSRVIQFIGAEIPDPNQSQGWGDPVLQIVNDAVVGAGTVNAAGAQLVHESKIDVIKIPELSENLKSAEYEGRLRRRFGMANMIKSIYSLLLVDKEEEWERIEANFQGLPDMLKMYLLIASGAADIPATRMLGQSPAGLSATGDSDTRNYYDRVSTEQKIELQPRLDRLDQVLVRSALGEWPEGMFYNWNSLWQMTDAEKAEIATKRASVMTADSNAGLIAPTVLKKARENQLIEDGTYPGFEQLLEEFDEELDTQDVPPELDPNLDPGNDNNDPGATDPNGINDPEINDPAARALMKPQAKRSTQVSATKSKRAANDRAVKRVRARIRIKDARPRTAYVRRDVLNAAEIIKWAKSQGFTSTVRPDELHVTVAYIKTEFNWLGVDSDPWGEEKDGSMIIQPGGPRMMEAFDGGATVLVFAASRLGYRHRCIFEAAGIDSPYGPEFNPHITITYVGAPKDLSKVEPYQGVINLGPEIWEELDITGNKDESYKTR
jgi:phage-related protein (TIGR01555 family)